METEQNIDECWDNYDRYTKSNPELAKEWKDKALELLQSYPENEVRILQ